MNSIKCEKIDENELYTISGGKKTFSENVSKGFSKQLGKNLHLILLNYLPAIPIALYLIINKGN